jgi:hypothetical protein
MTPERFNSGRTRNERRASRAVGLVRKAERLHEESDAAQKQAKRYRPDPPDQPILIGHHSERRHRNALRKSNAAMDKCLRLWREAKETERLAHSAAENAAIRTTDADAIELLTAKKAELEREREWRKAVNEVWRANGRPQAADAEGWAAVAAAMEEPLASFDRIRRTSRPSSGLPEVPFPAYSLQNIGANIRRVAARIKQVERAQTKPARPERRIGTAAVRDNPNYDSVEIHFNGKPPENVLGLLRRHGFRWIRTARCWSRRGRNGTTEWKLDLIAKEIGVAIESASPEAANGGDRWNS